MLGPSSKTKNSFFANFVLNFEPKAFDVAIENGYKPINSKEEKLTAWEVAIRITNGKAAQKDLYENVIEEIADLMFQQKH